MGADIHAYLELVARRPSCAAHFFIPRDYVLFSLLAGVRYDPSSMAGLEPLYPPRGLPQPLSSMVFEASTYAIDDDYAALEVDGYCASAEAEGWVAAGAAAYCDPARHRVTDPDIHSASWLTLAELAQVRERYRLHDERPPVWLDAIIGAMQGFAANQQPGRLVFWFKG